MARTIMSLQDPLFASLQRRRDIEFVRLTWVDHINFIRYRVIPFEAFVKLVTPKDGTRTAVHNEDHARLHAQGITLTKTVFGLVFIELAAGFGPSGEYVYVPDLRTLRRCAGYAPGHVSIHGWFQEKRRDPSTPVLKGLGEFDVPVCPRTVLQRIINLALQESGVEFLAGIETEFILLNSTSPIDPVNTYGWSEANALSAGTKAAQVLEEISCALTNAGIEVQMYHAEAAPGQYELVTGPLPPLEAADALVHTRETIFNIASKHGLRATLAPRLHLDNCGSGAHTHLSVRRAAPAPYAAGFGSAAVADDRERYEESAGIKDAEAVNRLEASFLQGLLDHLPGACAFTLPTAASYARMVDGVWSGGTWVAWGKDNRETPVRLCGADGGNVNFEVKCVDGTSSPYLSLAALLASGLLGIRSNTALFSKPIEVLASTLSPEERAARNILKRMPLERHDAVEYLQEDKALVEMLGDEFVDMFIRVNEKLAEKLGAGEEDEIVKRLVENY